MAKGQVLQDPFLNTGRDTSDQKLLDLALQMGGTPVDLGKPRILERDQRDAIFE